MITGKTTDIERSEPFIRLNWRHAPRLIASWSTRFDEFVLGWQAIFYGLLLWLPAPTFSNAAYSHMQSMMAEDVWGLVFVVAGLLQMAGPLLEGRVAKTWRIYACVPMFFLFATVGVSAIGFSISVGAVITGVVSFGWVALAEFYLCLRLSIKRDAHV